MVIAADKKRTELLAKEADLLAKIDVKSTDELQAELKEVIEELEAIGAHSAEGRARRILAVRKL